MKIIYDRLFDNEYFYRLRNLPYEELHTIYVLPEKIQVECVGSGNAYGLTNKIDYVSIMQKYKKNNCKGLIYIHNHPQINPYEDNCRPSKNDIIFAKNVYEEFRKLGYNVSDFVILTQNSYFSFYENQIVV